jgi:hypothetical protein
MRGIRPACLGVLIALALPASSFGVSHAKFGAAIDGDTQPNVKPKGQTCKQADPDLGTGTCTRVAVGFGEVGAVTNPSGDNQHRSSPRAGDISRLRLVAAGPGHFRPYLAKVKRRNDHGGKAKVVEKGPNIEYEGDNVPPYTIEVFRVDMAVRKGEFLAIKARQTSMLQCNSTGNRQLLFEPPLSLDTPFSHSNGIDGCVLLLQAVYR